MKMVNSNQGIMKIRTLKLMACAAIMALTLSVTACGSSNDSTTTLESYFSDPSAESIMDSMLASMSGDGMSAAIDVKGNEFTVIIKFEDNSVVTDDLGEALGAALDAQADTVKEQVADFDEIIGKAGACTVVYRYTDADDNVIVEKSFKAD